MDGQRERKSPPKKGKRACVGNGKRDLSLGGWDHAKRHKSGGELGSVAGFIMAILSMGALYGCTLLISGADIDYKIKIYTYHAIGAILKRIKKKI